MVFPAWLAVIEQVPVATSVTAVPDTAQTDVLLDVKVTGKPELAVATSAGGVELGVASGNRTRARSRC